jgi:class 3 adenylate cyclase
MNCPACGSGNAEAARFCSTCGAELGRERTETRKTVTVVFADVAGSTALGERLDAEALRRVMGRYFERMRAVVERHGAVVEKFIGDAVMAVFGVPQVREDDALRAVRAAADMRGELVRLNDELLREVGVSLELRIGVNTGEVVAGDAAARERLVTGDAVNVAARLEQAAAPGEILLGDGTRALVDAAVEVQPVEALALKGKSEPVVAWRLRGVTAGASGFVRRFDTPLVGRARELATLVTAIEGAFARRAPHMITIVGAAGIGKSRLTNEVIAAVSAKARVLVGRCLSYGEGITYWPLAEILRQAGDVGDPEVRDVLAQVVERAAGGSADDVAWATRRLCESLAEERPLLVVFDDIHWAEPTLLDLVEYVGTFAVDVPLVLLCQARPELAEARPGWLAPRAAATTLVLEPLDDAEAGVLVHAFGPELDAETRARIAAAAEGNPLFLEQMAAMAEEGTEAGEVPSTIQALLAARVDLLDPDERDVVQRAAVQGRIFHRGAVAELLPDELRPLLSRHLVSLVRKDFIRPDRSSFAGEDGFRFAHILVRDAVYASAAKELRADLHERFARWLDGHAATQVELEEIVGYHVEQAFRHRVELGLHDGRSAALASEAAARLERAGRRAYARSDVTAAVNLLERALSLARDVEARAELLPLVSLAVDFGGDPPRAAALAEEAVLAAEATGDARLLAQARTQRLAVRFHTVPGASAAEFAAALVDAAAVFAERGDEYGQALAWRRLAWVRQVEGRFGDSVVALDRAHDHARRVPHDREEWLATAMLALSILEGPTPVGEAIRRCQELQAVRRRLGFVGSGINTTLGVLFAMTGEFDRARALIDIGWEMLGQTGDVHARHQGATMSGKIELLAGDAAAAERHLRAGFDHMTAMGDTAFAAPIATRLAEAVVLQGRIDEAFELTELVAETANPSDFGAQGSWRATRARCLHARGELEEAVAVARAGVELVGRTDSLNAHADILRALAEVSDGDESERATAAALALYERKGNRASAELLRASLIDVRA